MHGIDLIIDQAIEPLRRSRLTTRALVHITNSAVYSLVWLGVCGLGWLLNTNNRRLWAWLAVGVVVEWLVTNGPVKMLFRRSRPANPLDNEWTTGIAKPKTSSFPSGHSSASGFMIAATFVVLPGWWAILVIGVLVAFSRIFMRVHHATDVFAGLAWGVLLGITWRLIFL